jgi:hypothetical protein
VVPWFADRYADGADWRALAWWIHDHLPYHHLQFFPKLAAFNITWREEPERIISSYIARAASSRVPVWLTTAAITRNGIGAFRRAGLDEPAKTRG